ncbi:MAG TPA: alpha/beta fold hydrolase [Gemmatimonadaceae bacterium]|jgi:pimeloyl-ACP methyl ester carboxylesterase|nr:alpha/beta fold hydrolase [Gemmatimonadaceae bacterium]
MRGEFVDVGGARLYYYATGTRGVGEPVVLIHGFPTSSHLWRDVAPLIPDGHRVVVIDLLGYGRSDPPNGRDLSIRGHAERVIGLLDALRISYASIVGHDLGGGIAQYLAVRHPTRVARLALIDSVAFDDWPTRPLKLARTTLPLTRFLPATWILSILRSELERGYAHEDSGARSIDIYVRPFCLPNGRDVLVSHLEALDAEETVALQQRLKDIVAPTAIVSGAHDPFLPPALAKRLHATIPGASLNIIADVRHFTPEEAPETIGAILSGWLQR